ncbi:MAG: ArnT family glycosyltransferase, partial [Acidimicrobiia bacterium]
MSRAVVTPLRAGGSERNWRVDAAVLTVAAIVIRLPAFVADAHLTYDDGVFASSALLLRDGELPFRDIFSPQGPLFLPLVWAADLVGLHTATAARLLPLASGAVVTVATYAAGRRITSRGGALLAAGLVTTSGSVLWTTAPITSDGPAFALATTAVALALTYRAHPTTGRAVAVGVAMGAALCVKVLVLPAVIPVGVLLLSRRRSRDVAIAAGAAVVVGLVVTAPWGFGRVWEQYIDYHRGSARIASHAGAARKLVTTLIERDSLVVAAGVL